MTNTEETQSGATGCCDTPPSPPGAIKLSDYLIQLYSSQTNTPVGLNLFIREITVPDNVALAFGLPHKLILQPGLRTFRQLLNQDIVLSQDMANILGRPGLVGLYLRDLSVQRDLPSVPLPSDPTESEVASNLTIFHGTSSPGGPPLDPTQLDAFIAASNFLRALERTLLQKLLDTFIAPVFETECPLELNPHGNVYLVVESTGNSSPASYREPIAVFREESQALLLVRLLTEAIHSAPVTIDYSATVAALRAVWPNTVKNGISTGFDIPTYDVVTLPLYSKEI